VKKLVQTYRLKAATAKAADDVREGERRLRLHVEEDDRSAPRRPNGP
jgi:hypothetical protein